MNKTENTCCGRVQDSGTWGRFHLCGRTAKFFEGENYYCGTHAPSKVAVRRQASDKRFKEEMEMRVKAHKSQMESARRAGCYDELTAEIARLRESLKNVLAALEAK